VHGVNFELGEENLSAQLQMLQPYLQDYKGPLILAGDFNTWSDGRTKALMTFAARFNLRAVEFAPDARTTALGYPLDHILLRGLAVLESGVGVTDRSDHNLLWVTVVQSQMP
jgi:endonuclease/exonuclease/phosphatase (EEP) superfamily protein YafD